MNTDTIVWLFPLAVGMAAWGIMLILNAVSDRQIHRMWNTIGARYGVERWQGEGNQDYAMRIPHAWERAESAAQQPPRIP